MAFLRDFACWIDMAISISGSSRQIDFILVFIDLVKVQELDKLDFTIFHYFTKHSRKKMRAFKS